MGFWELSTRPRGRVPTADATDTRGIDDVVVVLLLLAGCVRMCKLETRINRIDKVVAVSRALVTVAGAVAFVMVGSAAEVQLAWGGRFGSDSWPYSGPAHSLLRLT